MLEKTKTIGKPVYVFICVFLAFCLWAYVSYELNPEMTRTIKDIPVIMVGEARLNENGRAVKSISDTNIDLKLTAKRSMFKELASDTIKAVIDVSQISSTGSNIVTASVTFPSNTSEVVIVNSKKLNITVNTEEYMSASIFVEPVISKPLPDGYYIKSQMFESGEMLISALGCRSDVEKVTRVITDKVDLSTVKDNVAKNLTFTAVDEDDKPVPGVKLSVSQADVIFEIYKRETLPLTLEVTNDDPELIYELVPSKVTVSGPAAVIDELTPVKVGSVNELRYSDGSSVSFNIPLSGDITIEEPADGAVTVKFTKLVKAEENGE